MVRPVGTAEDDRPEEPPAVGHPEAFEERCLAPEVAEEAGTQPGLGAGRGGRAWSRRRHPRTSRGPARPPRPPTLPHRTEPRAGLVGLAVAEDVGAGPAQGEQDRGRPREPRPPAVSAPANRPWSYGPSSGRSPRGRSATATPCRRCCPAEGARVASDTMAARTWESTRGPVEASHHAAAQDRLAHVHESSPCSEPGPRWAGIRES